MDTEILLKYVYSNYHLLKITYPDGTIIEQEYDSLNRITAVNQYAQFLWNGNAQPEQITYQNGVTTDYFVPPRMIVIYSTSPTHMILQGIFSR
ncbi:MAG: hypothetical protein HXS54_06725 [Theionarchaea archaeon]|nr:hypothetical protein [Theionarchaea archaeon]